MYKEQALIELNIYLADLHTEKALEEIIWDMLGV